MCCRLCTGIPPPLLTALHREVLSCTRQFITIGSFRSNVVCQCRQVMEATALVVNALPAEQRPEGLQRVFTPVVQPMHALLAAAPQPHNIEQREAILTLADRLGILFRFVERLSERVWACYDGSRQQRGLPPAPHDPAVLSLHPVVTPEFAKCHTSISCVSLLLGLCSCCQCDGAPSEFS